MCVFHCGAVQGTLDFASGLVVICDICVFFFSLTQKFCGNECCGDNNTPTVFHVQGTTFRGCCRTSCPLDCGGAAHATTRTMCTAPSTSRSSSRISTPSRVPPWRHSLGVCLRVQRYTPARYHGWAITLICWGRHLENS